MSKNKNNKPVWSTRIKKNSSSLFAKVGSSINIDKRLYKQDIAASIIHAKMLIKQKIISGAIGNIVIKGFEVISKNIKNPTRTRDIIPIVFGLSISLFLINMLKIKPHSAKKNIHKNIEPS